MPPEASNGEERSTPGFTPVDGEPLTDTPGFVAPEEGAAETAGAARRRKRKADKEAAGAKQADAEGKRGGRPAKAGDDGDDGEKKKAKKAREKRGRAGQKAIAEGEASKAQTRAAAAKEALEKRKQEQKARRARLRGQQVEEEQEVDPEEELILESLTHHISLEDLEQYLGIAVVPDDRAKLERRWQTKVRDNSIRHLLTDAKSMRHPYALVPRLNRFFKGGKAVNTTVVELLRNFPQLFDNPATVINQYKAEALFARETPVLDWALVACEALPGTLNKSYGEQKTVIKQYAQEHQANEMRIRRRTLVKALYDLVVIHVITKENVLSSSVDLTESKVGRQNFACINFGEKGLRIGDVGRQDKNARMGMCPSW